MKAIDFDSAVDLSAGVKYLNEVTAHATPLYVSPEVAKYLVSKTTETIAITNSIDIFALGLIIFEWLNPRRLCLWEELGVKVGNTGDVFHYATELLTNDEIAKVLIRCFPGNDGSAIRLWLLDALQVSPLARWDAKALQTRHSLLAGTAGTIDMHQLRDDLHVHGEKITKAIALEISTSTQVVVEQIRISEKRIMYESAVNFDQLHNTLISFREEVLMGFSTLGESLLQVAAG